MFFLKHQFYLMFFIFFCLGWPLGRLTVVVVASSAPYCFPRAPYYLPGVLFGVASPQRARGGVGNALLLVIDQIYPAHRCDT